MNQWQFYAGIFLSVGGALIFIGRRWGQLEKAVSVVEKHDDKQAVKSVSYYDNPQPNCILHGQQLSDLKEDIKNLQDKQNESDLKLTRIDERTLNLQRDFTDFRAELRNGVAKRGRPA